MLDDILDSQINTEKNKNDKYIKRIALFAFLLIIISIGLEYLSIHFDLSIDILGGSKLQNLLMFPIQISFAVLVCNNLNKFNVRLSISKILSYSSLILFLTFTFFKILQFSFFLDDDKGILYGRVIIAIILFTLIGVSIVSIRIHKLRSKSTFLSIIMLIALLVIVNIYHKSLI